MISHPTLKAPPRWLLLAAMFTVALLALLMFLNSLIVSHAAPQGMVSLQLAATAEHTINIMRSWGDEGLYWASVWLWLEFLFVPAYLVTLLGLTSYLLSDRPGVREQKTGRWVKVLFVGMATADAAENVVLLSNLSAPSDNMSVAATLLALAKFTCLVIGITGLIMIRAARRRPLHPEH